MAGQWGDLHCGLCFWGAECRHPHFVFPLIWFHKALVALSRSEMLPDYGAGCGLRPAPPAPGGFWYHRQGVFLKVTLAVTLPPFHFPSRSCGSGVGGEENGPQPFILHRYPLSSAPRNYSPQEDWHSLTPWGRGLVSERRSREAG